MELIIAAIVIGFIVGAVLSYLFQQQRLAQKDRDFNQILNKNLKEAENNYQSRMEETVTSLQKEYEQKSNEKIEQLNQQHQAQIQEFKKVHQRQIEEAEKNHQVQLKELNQDYQKQIQEASKLVQKQEEKPNEQMIKDSEEIKPIKEKVSNIDKYTPQIPVEETSVKQQLKPSNLSLKNSSKTSKKKEQDLSSKISALAESCQITEIPQLGEYIYHPDSNIRASVASALGEIANNKGIRKETEQAIPILGKLSRDSEASVRQIAVEALGKIKSKKVIPLLQMALRDFDSDVVKLASNALTQFKI
ncbi:MAG: hypothetical protein F6K10_24545 [Moorea sp. SIO2B7]|nr:hypothetical protein [Moorena sp. SIO2B7]